MSMLSKLIKIVNNPFSIVPSLGGRGKLKFISDKTYLKATYRAKMKKPLNLVNPQTFNEKLQYLKLYDRNTLYTNLVDKYEVRKYVEQTIGGEYLIPLIGVWNKFDDIDFEKLPKEFVLKCNHDSGMVIICKDKSKLDIEKARKKINKTLKRNYFYSSREWPYKNVKPKIICEVYMKNESRRSLLDYKFFCFNGKPRALFIASDRGIDTKFDFYDMEFNHLPLTQKYKNNSNEPSRPRNFDKMVELSTILSKDFPHVRVDFYEIEGKVYFGELTFYHFGGLVKFEPEEYDKVFGEWIEL